MKKKMDSTTWAWGLCVLMAVCVLVVGLYIFDKWEPKPEPSQPEPVTLAHYKMVVEMTFNAVDLREAARLEETLQRMKPCEFSYSMEKTAVMILNPNMTGESIITFDIRIDSTYGSDTTSRVLTGKPSWEIAPKWANWLAQDSNGSWFWYEHKPHTGIGWIDNAGVYGPDTGKWKRASDDKPNENWKETLEKRPKDV